ncbi:flavin-containing monooxygenase [Parendozoicomonas haliclonae]|uniref:Cyclohexanone 1,2-monooxygenase n=1 Tax=Parendozoicomonas haliclonae TaxID=1960125 RepID=A0A1X7AP17_9GAMM|nr:NAD(P)-binding domain-containing protein [Parendozoicomonas haliclonae]SMA49829.1 Cyclohexanone 1,2-monooxygenase [Parendozoicomonas haliclonae]
MNPDQDDANRYAIIGAGPMGLACARQLQRYGIAYTGLEQHSDVGGLWDIDNPHSTMYDSAHLISSKGMTEFTEFPMPEHTPTYPKHSTLKQYFQDYAAHFGLSKDYEFNTRVVSVEPEGDKWVITTEHQGEKKVRRFAGVLIANGTLHHPNRPELPGNFSGELYHACDYRSPELFKGKRVLIIGAGNSGCDIAVDAVHHADSVDFSTRRGYYFLPKFIMGKPSDSLGGKVRLPRRIKQTLDAFLIRMIMGKPSQYGLPDPDYRMYESHPVINSLILHHLGHGDITPRGSIQNISDKTVTFENDEQQDYDLILTATGYKLHYPFIRRELLNWQQGGAPSLYLNAMHPDYDNLFMMGMVEAAGLGWQGRAEQAEMIALYIRQLTDGKASAQKLQQIKKAEAHNRADGGYDYLKLDRMAYYVEKETYRKAVNGHIHALRQDLNPALQQTTGEPA